MRIPLNNQTNNPCGEPPNGVNSADTCGDQATVSSSPDMAHESPPAKRPRAGVFIFIAWFLLALTVLALTGMLSNTEDRHRAAFSDLPMEIVIARFLGLMTGANVLTIPALLLGLYSWIFRKSTGAKWVVAVAVILIITTTLVVFSREIHFADGGHPTVSALTDDQQKHEARKALSELQDRWSKLVKSSTDSDGSPKRIEEPTGTATKATGDLGEIERFMKDFMDQMASQRNDYLLELEAIGWNGILDANRIRADNALTATRIMIRQAKDTVHKYSERTNTLLSDTREKIRSLNVSDATKRGMLSGFDQGMANAKQNIDRAWSLEKEAINECENIINLLSAKPGAWVVQNEKILFYNADDLSEFNSYMTSIRNIVAQQEAIQRQGIETLDHDFDRLKKIAE